jgi:hypothetical protein
VRVGRGRGGGLKDQTCVSKQKGSRRPRYANFSWSGASKFPLSFGGVTSCNLTPFPRHILIVGRTRKGRSSSPPPPIPSHDYVISYLISSTSSGQQVVSQILSQAFRLLSTSSCKVPHVGGSLSPMHGATSCCGWRRRPPDTEDSCEYIEQAVVDNRQGVVLQLEGSARG